MKLQHIAMVEALVLGLTLVAAEEEPETKEVIPEVPVEPLALRNDKALAEQLEDDQVKWLMAGDNKFLGIFKANSKGKTLGSLLILPAAGNTPRISGALPKLADDLSRYGWHSLAISLPQFNFSGPKPNFPDEKTDTEQTTEALTEEAVKQVTQLPDEKVWYEKQQTKNMEMLLERLLAAEAELLTQGGEYVIIAQGSTAELVLELISSKVIKPSGLVTLNIQHPSMQRSSKIATNLSKIKIPVLDIYNQPSDKLVLKRKRAQISSVYSQLYVPGVGINYLGSEQLLVNRVKGWLNKRYSK